MCTCSTGLIKDLLWRWHCSNEPSESAKSWGLEGRAGVEPAQNERELQAPQTRRARSGLTGWEGPRGRVFADRGWWHEEGSVGRQRCVLGKTVGWAAG